MLLMNFYGFIFSVANYVSQTQFCQLNTIVFVYIENDIKKEALSGIVKWKSIWSAKEWMLLMKYGIL